MYYLPNGYKENVYKYFNDTHNRDEYQDGIYKYAREVMDYCNYKSVLDWGCGSGYKLRKWFMEKQRVGVDVAETVKWLDDMYPKETWLEPGEVQGIVPELVVCSDVIEHVERPDYLLDVLSTLRFRRLVISTPDRDKVGSVEGPPRNECHVREWSRGEFMQLVNMWFEIEQVQSIGESVVLTCIHRV